MKPSRSLAAAGASIDEDDYPSAPEIESRTYRLFGGGITPLLTGNAWTERVAAAMILGICPVLCRLPGGWTGPIFCASCHPTRRKSSPSAKGSTGRSICCWRGKYLGNRWIRGSGLGYREEERQKTKKDRGDISSILFFYILLSFSSDTRSPRPDTLVSQSPKKAGASSGVLPCIFWRFSSRVLHSMQYVVTGLAIRRLTPMGSPHSSQIP